MKPVERQVEARRVNDVQIFLVRCVKGRKTHRSSYLLVSGEMSPRIAYFCNVVTSGQAKIMRSWAVNLPARILKL